jgi:hypothetical protein
MKQWSPLNKQRGTRPHATRKPRHFSQDIHNRPHLTFDIPQTALVATLDKSSNRIKSKKKIVKSKNMVFLCLRCDVEFGLAASRDRHMLYMEARAINFLNNPEMRLSPCSLIVITLDPEAYGFHGEEYVNVVDVMDGLEEDEVEEQVEEEVVEEPVVEEPVEEIQPGVVRLDGPEPQRHVEEIQPGAVGLDRPEPQRHVAVLPRYTESQVLMN